VEFKGSEMVEIRRVEFDRGRENCCGRSGGGGEKNPSLYFNQDLEERRGETYGWRSEVAGEASSVASPPRVFFWRRPFFLSSV
jgi:hypothetical protein